MDKITRTYNVAKLTTEQLNELIAQHDNEHAQTLGYSNCLCLLDADETTLDVMYWGAIQKPAVSHTAPTATKGDKWYRYIDRLENALLVRGDDAW